MAVPQILRREQIGPVRARRGSFRAAAAGPVLVRLRPGAFTTADEWANATPEERVITRARALQAATTGGEPIFSHETAAALHGLPLYRADRERVHVIVADARPGSALGTVRHRGELRSGDVVRVRGLLCTSLERTVADVARTGTFEQAVVVADAALRRQSVPRNGVYLVDRAEEFRAGAREIAHRSAQGVRRADRVLAFADGRAQLPGESISRIRLVELGFGRIRLQVRVDGPHGGVYWVDFALDDPGVESLGEFDGAIKYVDGRLLAGRSALEAFDQEKQREDWIRGRTQRRLARWGWPHIDSADLLGRRLAAFGIVPPA
ncbi:hypothetical protein [Microbacterium luticocti]|uniref:hypothetical protein n=1 Tax=Microbacterium luticocti TaxID=451764 RepID=UPI0003FC8C9E|nr:hypothetical protein [Microbacterium luticocti]